MSGFWIQSRVWMRYVKRVLVMPNRVTEILVRLKSIEAAIQQLTPASTEGIVTAVSHDPANLPGSVAGEIYAGYSSADLWLFDRFAHAQPQPSPGFVTDFIGTRTRTVSLWDGARIFDGKVMGRPIPHDLFEAIEWVGLLTAVLSSRGSHFAMMELGAGWGPWLAAGAVAARLRGITDLRLLGVEADPGRFALMKQNFRDNDLDPDEHRLVLAAVGVEAGHARWPRISDPANAGGARPVKDNGSVLDDGDVAYMRGTLEDYVEVDIVPLSDLLSEEPIWDLVHIDVQGWEAQLCAGCIETLNDRARWLVIGTHSRVLDGQVMATMHDAGWFLENEKPTRFTFDPSKPSIDSMAEVDGAQIWRNPRLANPLLCH